MDGGDLLFSKPQLGERALASEMIRARTLIEGYNALGTAAMTIGESDLAAGLPFLLSMAEAASFPIVSANLVDEVGQPIFAPYALVDRAGMKVAVLGASSVMAAGEGYRFTDPLTALKTQVAAVRKEADLVVLLFHGSKADQKRIADAGLAIDVVLHSHLGGTAQADRSNRVPVALLGSEGKRLTALTVVLRKPGEPVVDLSEIQRTITFVDRSIERLSRNQRPGVPLEEIYADNPQVLKRLAVLRDRESMARAELAKAANTLIGRRIPLDRTIADDPKLLSMVNETLAAVEELEQSASGGGS